MIKDIKYNGHTTQPSDYSSPDGDLALSVNVINEDGGLSPIPLPSAVRDMGQNTPICTHKVAGGTVNIIAFNSFNRKLLFASLGNASATFHEIDSWEGTAPTVAVIGNTLVFSDGSHSLYALWDADTSKYRSLGQAIPEIHANFALAYDRSNSGTSYTHGSSVKVTLPSGFSASAAMTYLAGVTNGARVTVPAREPNELFVYSLSNAIMGALNSFLMEATSDNYFVQPFMLRWALRLFDGSYVHHSAPILMIPNSAAPYIPYGEPSESDGIITIPIKIVAYECRVMFRITGLAELLKWKDIVHSLDVFVSAPIYTYDQSGTIGPYHRSGSDYYNFSIAGLPSAISDGTTTGHPPRTGSVETVLKNPTVYNFDLDGKGNTEKHLVYDYSHDINPARFSQEHIEQGICDIANFYLVSSIPIFGNEELTGDMEGFAYLPLEESALTNLVTRPRLEDDYRSHDVPFFTHAFPFNSRSILSGVSSQLFPGFPLLEMGQYKEIPDYVPLKSVVYVKIVRNGASYWVYNNSGEVYDPKLPRYLYYPDANAVEMRIIIWKEGDSESYQRYSLPLKSHDFLNGSYWFAGLGDVDLLGNADTLPLPIVSEYPIAVPDRSKVFVSEVNNPFYYPLGCRITVGIGETMATSAAVQALSQGQFGQHPLYAFTSEGVWALSVSATGTISACQPVSRDVCTRPSGITQLDSAVLFPTDRGLILLAGSQAQCITDVINSKESFNVLQLPGLATLHSMLGHTSCTCLPTAPLLEFVAGCGIIYDYVHQRVIVYNPNYTYAYVYSLKSKEWGMMYSTIKSGVNSYPEALAVNNNGTLLNFSSSDGEPTTGLFVTRPIKLETPDVLKTMDTVIQRGHFQKGHVQSVLYGSRDLFNWHLIWSSKDHYLRGFRGTPYKYFRIACVTTLADGESVFGASLQFNPRQTDQPR